MTPQEIKVDVFGRPIAAYKETDPVSLKVLGPQRIERFSQIVHDEASQKFVIVFDKSAPDFTQGTCAFYMDFAGRGVSIPVPYTVGVTSAVMFDTYADGVKAEQALLSAMLRTGEL